MSALPCPDARARKAEYMRQWRARNPEKCAAWKKRYYDANRERILAQEKQRYEGKRQLVVFQNKARRARSYGAHVSLTDEQWDFALSWWGPYCPYCRAPLPVYEATLDHAVALSRGGGHTLANCVPCCLSCNSSKQHRPLAEWLADCECLFGRFDSEQFLGWLEACAADWEAGVNVRRAA